MKEYTLPSDSKAEHWVLGACLNQVDAANTLMLSGTDAHFSTPELKYIFNAIKTLYGRDAEITPDSVAHQLHHEGNLEKAGGFVYLTQLYQTSHGVDYAHYIDVIEDKFQLRQVMQVSNQFIEKASKNLEAASKIVEEYQNTVSNIGRAKSLQSWSLKEVVEGKHREDKKTLIQQVNERRDRFHQGLSNLRGSPTGWPNLDEVIGGLINGHLIIVGASPGSGKSTFCLNMAKHLSITHKIPTAFFSLEMTTNDLMDKILAMQSTVSYTSIQKGMVSPEDISNFISPAAEQMALAPLYIEDQQNMPIQILKSRANRLRQLYGVEAIFIDYLGYISTSEFKSNKVEQVSYISAELKGLAKSLDIPVICICQLNRAAAVQKREPTMSDLRDSGQIEANADEIILLHNPEQENRYDCPGKIIIKVVKNRFGRKQDFEGAFDGATGMITSIMTKRQVTESIASDLRKVNQQFDEYSP